MRTVSKEIARRVEKAPNRSEKRSAVESNIEAGEDEEELSVYNEELEIAEKNGISQQFSSEKILEDELVQRIENGHEVFEKKLKVYKRRGEYGRQYVIPIGRLDVLCEDAEKNLYIIELKKDSGYDDAYKQTRYSEIK